MLPSQYLSSLTPAIRLYQQNFSRKKFHVAPRGDALEFLHCFGKSIMIFHQVIHQRRIENGGTDRHGLPRLALPSRLVGPPGGRLKWYPRGVLGRG